jgi:FkbM family methyltransferase
MNLDKLNIIQTRNLLYSGEITREQYWEHLKSRLKILDNFKDSLFSSIETITISRQNVKISYNFFANLLIELEIKSYDTRSAANTIISNGEYEVTQMNVLCHLAKVSKYFVDIGSNVGLYSICLSLVNPKLKVASFEPNLKITKQQERNLQLNLIKNVVLYPFGLSNEKSDAKDFYIPKLTGSVGGSLINLHPEEGQPIQTQVVLRKFDELDNEIRRGVDLIKIDIEGAELEFLKGGLRTISEYKPIIVCELLRKWMKPFKSQPKDFLNILLDLGYTCFEFSEDGINFITEINEDTVANNFIFVHKNDTLRQKILETFII